MTNNPQPTPTINPWDMTSIYAASFYLSGFGGLFTPGMLMAARHQSLPDTQPAPAQQG